MRIFNSLLLLLALFAIGVSAFSQDVKESTKTIGEHTGNALSVSILRADEREIAREWRSIMKNYDGKVDIKGNHIYTTDAKIESISSGNVQVNAEINKEKDKHYRFTVIFKSEKGAVSSKDDISGFTAANYILKEFAKKLSIEAATAYKETQQKKLRNIQKEKANLENDNVRLTKDIENYQQKIKDAQLAIEENKKALLRNQEEQEKQEQVVLESVEELKSIK